MAVQAPLSAHLYDEQLGEIPIDGSVQRANAGFLAPGQSKIAICIDAVSTTGSDFIPLPTPPAGKIWIITDIVMTHDQASSVRVILTVGGVTVYSTAIHGSAAPDIMNSMETQPTVPGGLQPAIFVVGVASMHFFCNLYGIQQNDGTG